MKIDKAIEILVTHARMGAAPSAETLNEAELLGIEALKRHKEHKQRFNNLAQLLLPGETEE